VLGFCFPVFGQFPAFEHRRLRELGTGTPISPNKGMKKLTASQLIGQRGEFLVAERAMAIGFAFDVRSRLETGVDGMLELRDPKTGRMLAQWILFEAFIPRKFKSNSFAHRGARVIDTDTLLRISLVLRVSSDGQEHEQDSEDNPNVNAHQGITVELNAARTLALSRELCRVLSGRGLEIRPWPSRLVPPRAP
jgi:hypothetical protein